MIRCRFSSVFFDLQVEGVGLSLVSIGERMGVNPPSYSIEFPRNPGPGCIKKSGHIMRACGKLNRDVII